MEQIEVSIGPFTLRSRSLRVGHYADGLSRGLEPGELVLLRDPASELHHTAVVADIDFELTDTSYRLELGTRITAEEAAEWLQPPAERPADRLTTRDVTELIEQLRRQEQVARDEQPVEQRKG